MKSCASLKTLFIMSDMQKSNLCIEETWVFQSEVITEVLKIRLSKWFDDFSIQQSRWQTGFEVQMQVDTVYKWKMQKTHLINASKIDSSIFGGSLHWKKKLLEKKHMWWHQDLRLYDHWLTLKFSDLACSSRLISEWADCMLVDKNLITMKRNLLFEVLYNRKTALA